MALPQPRQSAEKSRPRARSLGFSLLLLLLPLAAYAGMASMQFRYGKLGEQVVLEFLGWYGLACAGFVAAALWVEWRGRVSLGWLWTGAVLFRLLLLLTVPTLSTDVYRYLWDGHVALNGVSPYAFPIEAPELDPLAIPLRGLANHTWMASPYLPAAQWLFAGVAFALPLRPLSFQIVAVIFDLLVALLVGRLLARAGLPRRRLLLYLWNPLVVVEVAHGAHVDVWMALLLLLGVWQWAAGPAHPASAARQSRFSTFTAAFSPALLAAATLTKLLPALLTPVLWWRWGWGQRLLFAGLTAGLLLPAGLRAGWGLSGPLDGRGLFGALRIYGDRWNFNSGLFHWLEEALQRAGVADFNGWAKRIVLLALVGLLLWVWRRARRDRHNLRASLRWLAAPLMGYALLTTTFHPWYLLVLLPFLPLLAPGADESRRGWLWLLPWLWLSGALALSYVTYSDPSDLREFEWVRRWEWLPTLALLGLAGIWARYSATPED